MLLKRKKPHLYPGKLIWNPKREAWKIGRFEKDINQLGSIGVVFRFHVNFPACNLKDPKISGHFQESLFVLHAFMPKTPCEIKST